MRILGGFVLFLILIGGIVDVYNTTPLAESLSSDPAGVISWLGRFTLLFAATFLGGASVVIKDAKLAKVCFWNGVFAAVILGIVSALSPSAQAKNAEIRQSAIKNFIDGVDGASKGDDVIIETLIADNRITNHPKLNLAQFRSDKISAEKDKLDAALKMKVTQSEIFGSPYLSTAFYLSIGICVTLTLGCGSAIGFTLLRPTAAPVKPATRLDSSPTVISTPSPVRPTVTDDSILSALDTAVSKGIVSTASVGQVKKAVLETTGQSIGTDRARQYKRNLDQILKKQHKLKAV